MRISDWSSDVCSSDLARHQAYRAGGEQDGPRRLRQGRLRPHLAGVPRLRERDRHHQLHRDPDFGVQGRNITALSENRSEEHTSELQSLMRSSYAVFCLKKKKKEYEATNRNTNLN